jgi:preprotein translocase subunit YajC
MQASGWPRTSLLWRRSPRPLPPAGVAIHRKETFVKLGSLLLPAIAVLFYIVIVVPQSRRRKQAAMLQRAVEPGSRVLLTSGLYAIVVEIDDDAIVVQAAPGVELRYAKAAILRVIPDETEFDDDDHDHADHEHSDDDDHDHDDHHDHQGPDDAPPDAKAPDDDEKPAD